MIIICKFINIKIFRLSQQHHIYSGKQSVNPAKDAAGAIKAAQSFSAGKSSQVIGYRYLEDPSLTPEQRAALHDNLETRKIFNVLTNSEIVSLLRSSLQSLAAPLQVVFLDQRCVDCGEEGDRRLLSPFCHLEKCLKHPGRLQRVQRFHQILHLLFPVKNVSHLPALILFDTKPFKLGWMWSSK